MKKIIIWTLILILFLVWTPITKADAQSGELIKGESFSAVYYKAIDGKRYVFPNQRIYDSWYADFSTVRVISDGELFDISLGGNVFYKPNSRLVKITTDPKVYWVDEFGILRHVISENTAQSLFGSNWISKIDDLPDEFFTGYTIGNSIDASFNLEVNNNWTIDDNKKLTDLGRGLATQEPVEEEKDEEEDKPEEEEIVDEEYQPDSINLTVTTDLNDQDANLTWFVSGGNTDYGFIVLKSETDKLPIYDPDGDLEEDEYYIIVDDDTADAYDWEDLDNGGAYYFRICRLNSDDSCGTYSDVESVVIGASGLVPAIILNGVVEDGVVKLSWEKQWVNPKYGFYLVRGTSENPKYPTNTYIWLDKTKESYNWTGLSFGTHHFRLCRYNGDGSDVFCGYYSNDLELIVE